MITLTNEFKINKEKEEEEKDTFGQHLWTVDPSDTNRFLDMTDDKSYLFVVGMYCNDIHSTKANKQVFLENKYVCLFCFDF